jgi:methylated-DNA-[protein]-cysteine S-methyltransferase
MTTFYYKTSSPIGTLTLASNGSELTHVLMDTPRYGDSVKPDWISDPTIEPLRLAAEQLQAYFTGSLKTFDLPMSPRGTDFQRRVWLELCNIPYGETISYGELATRIGNPAASRAVGLANGSNPIAVIVPCHRVIGSGGKLVGYGGGLARKRLLLDLENGILCLDNA